MMYFKVIKLVSLFFLMTTIQASATKDPVSDFLELGMHSNNLTGAVEEVYIVKADISGDGIDELFLSHQNLAMDKSGFFWEVYALKNNEYHRIIKVIKTDEQGNVSVSKSGIRFRKDAFYVGEMEGVEGTTLFSYWPSGGQTGSLMKIWLEGNLVKREKVRELETGPGSEGRDYLEELFMGDSLKKLTTAKVEDLDTEEKRLALIGYVKNISEPDESGFISRPEIERTEVAGAEVEENFSEQESSSGEIESSVEEAEVPEIANVEPFDSDTPKLEGIPRNYLFLSIVGGAVVLIFVFALLRRKG